jgi:hypothetical protein
MLVHPQRMQRHALRTYQDIPNFGTEATFDSYNRGGSLQKGPGLARHSSKHQESSRSFWSNHWLSMQIALSSRLMEQSVFISADCPVVKRPMNPTHWLYI